MSCCLRYSVFFINHLAFHEFTPGKQSRVQTEWVSEFGRTSNPLTSWRFVSVLLHWGFLQVFSQISCMSAGMGMLMIDWHQIAGIQGSQMTSLMSFSTTIRFICAYWKIYNQLLQLWIALKCEQTLMSLAEWSLSLSSGTFLRPNFHLFSTFVEGVIWEETKPLKLSELRPHNSRDNSCMACLSLLFRSQLSALQPNLGTHHATSVGTMNWQTL